MKPIELDLLELFANDKVDSLTFKYNKRMGSFIYSTWARWDVTIHILNSGDEGIHSSSLCKLTELSQKGVIKSSVTWLMRVGLYISAVRISHAVTNTTR